MYTCNFLYLANKQLTNKKTSSISYLINKLKQSYMLSNRITDSNQLSTTTKKQKLSSKFIAKNN